MTPEISFSNFVKKHRLTIGLTQAELARRVGCAAITIRKIEAGTLRPSVQIAERLAMALALPLEDRADFIHLARTDALLTPEPQPTPTPPPMPEEIGEEDLSGRAVRGFELAERIGEGGFGVVYRAVQPVVEREVAIKIILPQYANHPDFIRRFEAEAQLVARLEHPHIVPLYDYWREPNAAFLVMRLLRGGSLKDHLNKGPLPLPTVVRYLEQIGTALHAAHRFGIIHRDLKPANILLDEDENAYLADFGIAKNLGNPTFEDRTQSGVWMGSPAYISPEQIRAEPVLPQADIYCLGVLLYEMLTGELPFKGNTPIDYILQHLNQPLPSLTARNPALPPGLEPVILRATAKDPLARYADIPTLLTEFHAALDGRGFLDPSLAAWRAAGDANTSPVENPFKGLRPFGEADAEHFFGRETLTQELLTRMSEVGDTTGKVKPDLARFLAVIGPSGSGKSSVVKAGLIPALRRGGLPCSDQWFIVDFAPGAHPFEELEAALLRVAINPPEHLLGQLMDDERGLHRAVKRILPENPDVELVMVIDQFEELFTQTQDETTRAKFLERLVTSVMTPDSRLRVIVTLRADFIDRPLQYLDFGDLIRERAVFILPMDPDELTEAINGPAKQVGLLLEPGLTARLVRDVGDEPGTLPLLQYTLTELFERREGHRLTLQAYQESGGVQGALGHRAEEIYTSLDHASQDATEQLFLRLITLGEGIEDTRRRVRQNELTSLTQGHASHTVAQIQTPITPLITLFGKFRLLTFDRDPLTRTPTVEIAHEALIHEWPRLRAWLDENREALRLHRKLTTAAEEWLRAGEEDSFLLQGTRLSQFEDWAKTTTLALTTDERRFIETSLETRRQREAAEAARLAREQALEQRSRRNLRALVGVFAVATLVALLLSVFAFNQRGLAQENAAVALSESNARATQQVIAEEQADLAATNAANAVAEANARATQQTIAEEQRVVAEEQRTVAEEQQALAEEQRTIAEEQQALAEAQTGLAISRELATASRANLERDPELSILLALQALETAYSREAEEMLHLGMQASREERTLLGHTSGVGVIVYSPDGKWVATSSEDDNIRIWDRASGLELAAIKTFGFNSWLSLDNAFSSDGRQIATMSLNKKEPYDIYVEIWDVANLPEVSLVEQHVVHHNVGLASIYLNPDWQQMAIGYQDGIVEIRNLETGEIVASTDHYTYTYKATVTYSPNGDYLLVTTPDGSADLWELTESGLQIVIPGLVDFNTSQPIFSDDGTLLMTGVGNGGAVLWELSPEEGTARQRFTLSGMDGYLMSSAISLDNQRVAIAGQDSVVIVFDITGEEPVELYRLVGHTDFIVYMDFSPDGTQLGTASSDSTARLWNAIPLGLGEGWRASPPAPALARKMVLSPDGHLLAVGYADGPAQVFDAETGALLATLEGFETIVPDFPGQYALSFSPDGRLLATGGADGYIHLWDVATWQRFLDIQAHEVVGGGTMYGTTAVQFSPDGTRLVSSGKDEWVKIWDPQTGAEVFSFQDNGEEAISGVLYSPDGKWLATGHNAPIVKIWDATTYTERFSIPVSEWSTPLAFSPDSRLLVTAVYGGLFSVLDIQNEEVVYNFPAQGQNVISAVFSADGQFLVSGGAAMRIWNTATWDEWLTLTDQRGPVALSQDGTHLYFAGQNDNVVQMFMLQIDDLITLAKARISRWFSVEECQKYLHTDVCPPDLRP